MCVKSDGSQPSRRMLLREEHLPGWALGRSPTLHTLLQGAQLPVLKTARILPLQVLKDRLDLKTGISSKQLLDLIPHLNERVRTRTPTHRSELLIVARHVGNESFLQVRSLLPSFLQRGRDFPPFSQILHQDGKALNRTGLVLSCRDADTCPELLPVRPDTLLSLPSRFAELCVAVSLADRSEYLPD
jgi:hypothetical protein